MTAYRYRAARSDGSIANGVLEAPSANDASATLSEVGLFPFALVAVDRATQQRHATSRRDLAIVFRSISALVSAGVPLERAVAASESLASGGLRATLHAARVGIQEGQGFAQALAAGPAAVPPVVLGMIRAGERGSQLDGALAYVATHLEQEAELVARLRQALAYPLLLGIVGTISVLVIGIVIVPRFAELLGDLGQDLPVATRALIAGCDFFSRFWFLLIALGLIIFVAAHGALRDPTGRRRLDTWLLAVPVVGPVRLALATARIGRALGSMLQAGMPLLPALEAARGAAGDAALAERLGRVRERVARGETITASLEREGALTQSALQLVAVGESSGRLGEMSWRAGDLAAQEAERGLKTLVTLVEPALILAFGALVAFVAAALLQAVYSIRPGGV